MTREIWNAETLARALGGKPHGRGWRCRCPAHDDHEPSLDIEDGETTVVFHCRTGCLQSAIIDALRGQGLWNGGPAKRTTKFRTNDGSSWHFVGDHVYQTKDGEPYLRVRKMVDENIKKNGKKNAKKFLQFRRDGGRWIAGAPKGPKVPYRLPELLRAPIDAIVFVCEGEKNADDLAKIELIATTQSGGASAPWDNALTQHFRNRHVVVLCDADKVGRRHAHKVAKALDGATASVRVLDLYPDCVDGSDVSDWLADDPSGVRLTKLTKDAALWQPASDSAGDEVGDDKSDAEITRLAKLPCDQI